MKILEVLNLSKSFKDPNGNKLKVLKDISFKMNKGDVLGIVGESGSGKTTLGRAILRLIEIDSGSILYNNINITNFSKTKMKVLRKDIQKTNIKLMKI